MGVQTAPSPRTSLKYRSSHLRAYGIVTAAARPPSPDGPLPGICLRNEKTVYALPSENEMRHVNSPQPLLLQYSWRTLAFGGLSGGVEVHLPPPRESSR